VKKANKGENIFARLLSQVSLVKTPNNGGQKNQQRQKIDKIMAKEVLNSLNEDDYQKRVEALNEKERHLDLVLNALKTNGNIPEVAQTDLERDFF
jgi:hypothetical protein